MSTVAGHRKALQIASNPIALGWVHWEGQLWALHVSVLLDEIKCELLLCLSYLLYGGELI